MATMLILPAVLVVLAPEAGAQTSPTVVTTCAEAQQLVAANLLTDAQNAFMNVLKAQPDSGCAVLGLSVTRKMLAEQAFKGAEALEDNGLHDEANKALSDAITAYPDQADSLAAWAGALHQRETNPFGVAEALEEAGFRTEALAEFKTEVKSHPTEFAAARLAAGKNSSFATLLRESQSESPNTVAWWQGTRKHALPWLRTGAEISIAAAVLLLLIVLVVRLARMLTNKPLLVSPFDKPSEVKLGDGFVPLMTDTMSAIATDVPGTSLNLVSEFEPVVSVSADVAAALPDGKYIAAAVSALSSILPARGWTVSGYLHAMGDRGVGVALSMTTRAKALIGEITLWEKDFSPTGNSLNPACDASYLSLAIPAGAWVLFQVRDEDEVRRLGRAWRRFKRWLYGEILLVPATTSWQSYAFFSLGAARERDKEWSAAVTFYQRALSFDPANRAALYNLAAIEIQDHNYKQAAKRLDFLNTVMADHRHRHRDPLWYRVQYMRAVENLNEQAGSSSPRDPTAARKILLEMLITLESSLLHQRGPVARVRAFFLRPALRQDMALRRILREFEGPGLIALAGVLVGTGPGPVRSPGPPLSPPDLVATLETVRDQPDNPERDVAVAQAVIDFAFAAANIRQTERFRYNYACYLAEHTLQTSDALDILSDVLKGNPDRVPWALADPSFKGLKKEDADRFDRLVGKVPSPTS